MMFQNTKPIVNNHELCPACTCARVYLVSRPCLAWPLHFCLFPPRCSAVLQHYGRADRAAQSARHKGHKAEQHTTVEKFTERLTKLLGDL